MKYFILFYQSAHQEYFETCMINSDILITTVVVFIGINRQIIELTAVNESKLNRRECLTVFTGPREILLWSLILSFYNGFKHWYIEQILLNFFHFNATGSIDDKLTHVCNGTVPIVNKPSPALTLNKLYEAISCYLGRKITVNVTPGTSKLIIPFCVYPSNSGFMNLRHTNLVITEYTVLSLYIDGLVQDCSISSALAMKIL